MKAAFIRQIGGPEMIEWGELPIPNINPHQVLVKVTAVAASPVDTYIRSGQYPMETPLPLPYIIGCEMVGVVSKVGREVANFKPGEHVWTINLGINGRQGSFAEYAVIEEDMLYHAPDMIDDKVVVSAIQAGMTACLGMVFAAALLAQDSIFINGGAGNVGTALIQLAKATGARVIATASGREKMQWCQSLGADLVLDYRTDDIEKRVKEFLPQGVDVYWDTSRQPNFDLAVALLAKHGRIVLMAGAGARPPFPVGAFYRKQCTMRGFVLQGAEPLALQQCAELINLCLRQGQLISKVAAVLPLAEAAKAHAMLEAKGGVWGKIVLTV